jgi:hypothetical protein
LTGVGGAEDFFDLLFAERKNTLYISAHRKRVHHSSNNSKGKCILHAIADERASVDSLKAMRVVPQLVWTLQLQIFKRERWLPGRDFGSPSHGNSMPMEPVVDQRAGEHLDGLGREDLKTQPWRSEQLEIGGVREKTEDFVE